MSPQQTLKVKKAHCTEGAFLAAAILWLNGEKPLVLDLDTEGDEAHVVALYKRNGYWGAISKTNHATVRFRDPIYKTIRELALSYFHEYFNNETRKKALISYSRPINLAKFGTDWVTSEKDLFYIVDALIAAPHFPLIPSKNKTLIRKADKMELRAGEIIEWKRSDPLT